MYCRIKLADYKSPVSYTHLHCDYCLEHKKCISHDDMLEVYEKLQQCDGIILATPVQSGGISSNLSAIMDRTRALEAVDYLSLIHI